MSCANDGIQERTDVDLISQWVITTRSLAKQAGCEQAIEPLLRNINDTQQETINIAVVGSPNSGKSSHINALLDRKILPVSGLVSNCAFSILVSHTEDERFIGANNSGPLSHLAADIEADSISLKKYQIHVASDWLKAKSIQLDEKPALDAADEELNESIEKCLRNVDAVILIIDALMAVTRSELIFMRVCIQRNLPLVITLSKTDLVADNERAVLSAYVAKHVEACDVSIPIINTSVTPTLTSGIDELKQALEVRLSQADLTAIRRQEVLRTLQYAINIILTVAKTSADANTKSQAELDREIKHGHLLIETMKLEWSKLDQAMHHRRLKIDNDTRVFLEKQEENIREGLLYDLARSTDIKMWWQRDLPFRLNREVKALAAQLSTSICKNIAYDIKWLQEELRSRFKFPVILAEPAFSIKESEFIQKDISLFDNESFHIISGVGKMIAPIAVGSLFVTGGASGFVVAIGTAVTLVAERVAAYNTQKDRETVHIEIRKIVQQALHEYAREVSRKVREGYEQILTGLRQYQERWDQAQLQALIAHEKKNPAYQNFDWLKLLGEVRELENEIRETVVCKAI